MTPNVAEYSERQNRAVQRILDQMERCNARTDQHYSRVRKHERKPYRGTVSVYLPTPDQPEPPVGRLSLTFTAWSYSLSQGGVGFIAPASFDETLVMVGVHLPNCRTRWLRGDIVRKREIPGEGFFDYGVAFRAAHQNGQPASESLVTV